jgi:hypothetical protein
LGLIYFSPAFHDPEIADLDFIQSEPFAMLSGTVLVLAVFTVVAGLVVMLANLNEE